ncbi:MAG: HTH domain-containing protein [Bacteroidales bacterium]|jgi:predicted HTH transcriptional regulator|nr:HTH domain-containing protein [Bacteroidales bacterium]
MIVIPTADRRNYLNVLAQCDKNAGKEPYSGANASLEQVKPLVDYITVFVEKKLGLGIQLAKGEIKVIEETDAEHQKEPVEQGNVRVNVRVKDKILDIITQMSNVTVPELAKMLSVTERTIYRNIDLLKSTNKLERVGSDKTGYWKINY